MKRILFDLSPPISAQTAVWPGDTAFSSEWMNRIGGSEAGFAINLSTIRTTVHLAAHADAPLHTEEGGLAIDEMDPEIYVGPCRVLERRSGQASSDRPGNGDLDLVQIEDLVGLGDSDQDLPPRVLVKTGSKDSMGSKGSKVESGFPTRFAGLSPALADHLHRLGVRLVGTDAPSVDPFDSKDLLAHHALLGRGIAVLEGLVLGPVPPGDYELIALPLRFVGLDASPVRAVLRALEG